MAARLPGRLARVRAGRAQGVPRLRQPRPRARALPPPARGGQGARLAGRRGRGPADGPDVPRPGGDDRRRAAVLRLLHRAVLALARDPADDGHHARLRAALGRAARLDPGGVRAARGPRRWPRCCCATRSSGSGRRCGCRSGAGRRTTRPRPRSWCSQRYAEPAYAERTRYEVTLANLDASFARVVRRLLRGAVRPGDRGRGNRRDCAASWASATASRTCPRRSTSRRAPPSSPRRPCARWPSTSGRPTSRWRRASPTATCARSGRAAASCSEAPRRPARPPRGAPAPP